jgi:hypothetical protein
MLVNVRFDSAGFRKAINAECATKAGRMTEAEVVEHMKSRVFEFVSVVPAEKNKAEENK